MKASIGIALFATLAIIVALGCGRGEETKTTTAPPKVDAPAPPAQAAAPPPAAAAAPTAAETCLALADKKSWTEALTPCTKAATQKPADLAIRHALQQAQAAAAGS